MAPSLKMLSLISLMSLVLQPQKTSTSKLNIMPTERVHHTGQQPIAGEENEYRYNQSVVKSEGFNNQSSYLEAFTNVSSVDCPSLEVLDFVHFNSQNIIEVLELEKIWPCEVRTYWLNMQGLVSTVRFLITYVTIGLVIVGLLVNLASLCVLSSPPMNTSSISVYLRALAISDIGALLFNITVGLLRAHSQKVNDFYLANSVMCFIQRFLSVVFFYYSTWLVVALTFERLVMIKSPFKVHQYCNFRPSTCVVIILGCVCLIIALIRTQITGFEKDNVYGYSPCGSSHKTKWNYGLIPFLAFTTLIPTTLIFIGNICLLLQIQRSSQNHSDLKASFSEEIISTFKISRMLLVISITYFVLLLPAGITGIIELYWKSSHQNYSNVTNENFVKWQQRLLLIKWIRGFFFFLFLLNYNINFFLYCVSGKKFRETVKICLQRWLPTSCQCICLKRQNNLPNTSSQKRRTLVTSLSTLSTLTLQQSETQSERHTSYSSVNSKQGQYNVAFVDSENTLNISKQYTVLR